MCRYNIAIDDDVMEDVRPSIANGIEENAWVQMQVELLFKQMAASRRTASFDDAYIEYDNELKAKQKLRRTIKRNNRK